LFFHKDGLNNEPTKSGKFKALEAGFNRFYANQRKKITLEANGDFPTEMHSSEFITWNFTILNSYIFERAPKRLKDLVRMRNQDNFRNT